MNGSLAWGGRARWLCVAAVFGALASGCSDDAAAVSSETGPLGDRLAVDERLPLAGLSAPVDAVRDRDGRVHVYAESMDDAMAVEGYMVARDRFVQMDFFRRVASGRLAEALGDLDPSVVEMDIAFRHVGLSRVAEQQWAELEEPHLRSAVEAYARGVSHVFAEVRSGERALPEGVVAYDRALFEEWTPVDSLVLARLQTWLLSYSGNDEIAVEQLWDDLVATFDPVDPDPALAKRAGMLRDFLRFAPPDPATTIDGFGGIGAKAGRLPESQREVDRTALSAELAARRAPAFRRALRASEGFRNALERARDMFAPGGDFGSNNWAVAPSRSQTGRAMLASDPHLSLSSPPVFWPVSIHVGKDPDAAADGELHVGGIAFPGIPGIVLGHNRHVAWGATVTMYDVTDVWSETLTADGKAVLHQGQEVPLEEVTEIIERQDGSSLEYTVLVVPHHGPIIPTIVGGEVIPPDPEQPALSVRWTGMEPTNELRAVFNLLASTTVREARLAMNDFGTGGQNWMLADVNGDIGWTSHVKVPLRSPVALSFDPATYEGLLPCRVLPGDGSADWEGFWDDASVPWAENPISGYLETANHDPVGVTLDNDPVNDMHPAGHSGYLGCSFVHGFRGGRIQQRIEGHGGALSLEDMSAIQGDWRSPLGSRLVPSLLLAIDSAQGEASLPGTHPDLTELVASQAYQDAPIDAVKAMLETWRDESDFVAHSGVDPDSGQALPLDVPEARAAQAALVFNLWLPHLLHYVLGDELARTGRRATDHDVRALLHLVESDPATLATYDPATGDSALFDDIDTPEIESRQERMLRALLDALAFAERYGGPMDGWRWGHFHTVRFSPLMPLWIPLSIPEPGNPQFPDGFPRPGDLFGVDASNPSPVLNADGSIRTSYNAGPTQRFVIELDPEKLEVRNALPGGAVWDKASPHFRDQAELWRRNQTSRVPFEVADVVESAETRVVMLPE